MAQTITLTTDGLLLNWLKNVGDSVKKGEVIAEVEADKATMEIEAPADGVLLSQAAEIGEELTEGAILGEIGEAGESGADAPADKSAEKEAPAEEASSSEATEEAPAPTSSSVTEDGRIKASPVARNIAKEKGVDLSQVQGTGPDGRITKVDVEGFKPADKPAPAKTEEAPKQSAPASAPAKGTQTWGKLPEENVVVEDISRMRRAIADSTILNFTNIPHFYVNREIKLDALLDLRKQINADLDGVKVSVNDMFVKAIALTLRSFPNLNSHYYGDKIVRHQRINIGISVALPNNGLVNVVAQDADKRTLSDLAAANKDMFDRAREGKIKTEDIKGATFSISNLGPYNVDWFSAIISAPEAGMLAVGAGKKKPVVLDDGTIGVATILGATLSIDHRVSDGAEGAQFLEELKKMIESPMRLLI
jgi:pyruvate dehydrogenase E2 component (dihydrolipoamide acetyltransferase)